MMFSTMTAFSCVVVALVLSSWTVDAFAPANPTQRHNSATMLDTIQFQAVSAQSTDIVKCNKPPSLFTFQSTAMINAALVGFGLAFCAASPAWADGQTKDFKFPPVDNSDENRCVLKSSSMGQANAARDALFDLRQCKLSNVNAVGYDLSGAVMTSTDASNANFKEAYFSKGFLRDSNFDGADFSNAIVDRANFKGSTLHNTLFVNAVLTGTSFEGADVEGADFTDAALGIFDLRNLCKNPTLRGENAVTGADTRLSAGCK